MDKFRIGIIGAGSIVEGNHLPAILSLDGAEATWIYDKNPARMALVSRMYGIRPLEGRLPADALGEVDICLLATPYGVRRPYIDLCREMGKALVVEKPFAFSKEEHMAYCSGFEEWEIAVNFQRRFYRSVGTIRQMISARMFGGLRSARLLQGNFSLKGGSGYLSSVELAGGGVIAESASHSLDILLSVTEAREVCVQQLKSLQLSGLDYDTVFDSEIVGPAGKLPVHCEISTLRNLANGLYLEFDNAMVSCDLSPGGTLFIRDPGNQRILFSLSGESEQEGCPASATAVNKAFLAFWRAFLDGLRQRRGNRTSASSAVLTSAWLEEIYKKIKST